MVKSATWSTDRVPQRPRGNMQGTIRMPSGGSSPISAHIPEAEWDYVSLVLREAMKNGLEHEWLDFLLGGIIINKKTPIQAADDAAIEWDF